MNIETKYYTGYEEDGEESEEEINESSDEESEQKFKEFLKSKSKKSIKKSELSKKDLADEFENEMNKELDDMIDKEHETYLKKLNEYRLKSDEGTTSQNDNQQTQPQQQQYEEEEDTDSEAEMETGVRTTKKRAHYTNDELFYDPNLDDEDESWVNKQRKTCKKIVSPLKNEQIPKSILKPSSTDSTTPSTSQQTNVKITYSDAKTDAILNCPCCMTVLTMDCQRHEQYKTQYRAMFVFNCKIKQDEILKYPLNSDLESNINKNKKKKRNKNNKFEKIKQPLEQEQEQMAVDSKQNELQQFDVYKPVVCEICNVEVGVYDDKDELFHFFNVLASHS